MRCVGSDFSLFGQPQSDRESMFVMRCLVQIRSKFWWHNPDVFHCIILGVQLEINEVMLLKFRLDLNLASHHKHALSVTLR
jgi:hypothetical protein